MRATKRQIRDGLSPSRNLSRTGMQAFCLKGHDLEKFVGMVRRYGADAAGVRAITELKATGYWIPVILGAASLVYLVAMAAS
jgi:hypothetical protein